MGPGTPDIADQAHGQTTGVAEATSSLDKLLVDVDDSTKQRTPQGKELAADDSAALTPSLDRDIDAQRESEIKRSTLHRGG